jgi:hypothetical protein
MLANIDFRPTYQYWNGFSEEFLNGREQAELSMEKAHSYNW